MLKLQSGGLVRTLRISSGSGLIDENGLVGQSVGDAVFLARTPHAGPSHLAVEVRRLVIRLRTGLMAPPRGLLTDNAESNGSKLARCRCQDARQCLGEQLF